MARGVIGVLLAAMTSPTVAIAQEFPEASAAMRDVPRDEDPAPDPPQALEWYGWQIIAIDAVAISAVVIGTRSDGSAQTTLVASGFGLFLLGGPIVHVANGEDDASAGSVGLRMFAPIGGALVGGLLIRAADGEQGLRAAAGGVYGFALGVATAMTVDSAVLAKKPVQWHAPSDAKVRVAPSCALTPNGGFAGVTGAF